MTGTGDFWSRRKAGVQAEAEAEIVALETEAIAATQEDKTDEELLAELNLPDPDSMQPGDDFSAFMKSAVPDRLRRRALRKLWLTNPVLANVDGLVDYGEDFTDSAMVIENLQTAYQVGKGMTKHVLEMVRQDEEAAAAEEKSTALPEETADLPEELEELAEPVPATTEEPLVAAIAPEPLAASEPEEQPVELPPRRRMQFAYTD